MSDPLVSAAEAIALHARGGAVFLDATWTFAGGPSARADGFIPGARPFDIDTVKDPATDLPHMLPPPDLFEQHARALGIGSKDMLVVYDRMGLFAAPRVWWMFRAMGHDNVRVLDGGLPQWIAAGGPLADRPASDWPPGDFSADAEPGRVADRMAVLRATETGSGQILDARAPARFAGREAEPRPGVRPGHMPGAINLHYATLLDPDGRLVADAERFRSAGLEDDRPVIATCGSGVTACMLALALERLGRTAAVYDGSWVEWGSRSDTPTETE